MTVTFEPVPYRNGLHSTSMTSAAVACWLNSPCATNDGSECTAHVLPSAPCAFALPWADAVPAISSKLLAITIRPAANLPLCMTYLQLVAAMHPLLREDPSTRRSHFP